MLVLEAGYATSNNLIRSLKAGDRSLFIVGCNVSRFFLKKSPAHRHYLLPVSTRDYIPALRTIIKKERIDLLIPTSDSDVSRLSQARRSLGRHVFLPSESVIARCGDKYELAVFLDRQGIRVPRTYAVTNPQEIETIFQRFEPGSRLWCRIRSGSGSYGAIPVRTPEQVRGWIAFWEEMRSVPLGAFTLAEYLPGRDFSVQCIFKKGQLVLAKMAERITYLNTGSPSGRSSMPALAKTVHDPSVIDTCARAVRALDSKVSGVFFVDLKENEQGDACITEINAGRFATMTPIHDLTGKHNMAVTYVRIALGKKVRIPNAFDFADGCYLVRSVDTLPAVVRDMELYKGIREVNA